MLVFKKKKKIIIKQLIIKKLKIIIAINIDFSLHFPSFIGTWNIKYSKINVYITINYKYEYKFIVKIKIFHHMILCSINPSLKKR